MRRLVRSVLAIVCALIAVPTLAAAQEGATISGRVTAETGAPLNSASVFLDGMNIGTVTKEDGRYQFVVPAARVQGQQVTLTARLIGYRAKSVTVTLAAGAIAQDFVLAPNPLRLGEVVVTGSGTTNSRERLGAVINSVDSAAITNSNSYNVVQALTAKAPNVNVTTQAGDPGASSYVRIRGVRSLTGDAQPLFVVDGTPIDNSTISSDYYSGVYGGAVSPNRASDIDPNDIENIQILKGSAAAAIYGAAASDGAVLITTKSGKSGATRFSFNSTLQLDDVTGSIPLTQGWNQGSGFNTAVCGGPDCVLTGASWGAPVATGTPVYNHFDELFRTGDSWDNNLTLSGGNDRTTFYASVGYLNQLGVITGPNNFYDKATVRLKASQRLADRINISGNLAYVDVRVQGLRRGSDVSGIELGGWRTTPTFNSQYFLDSTNGLHRSYRFPQPSPTSSNLGRVYDNPFFQINEVPNSEDVNRVYGNLTLDWEANDWLTVKDNLGADYYNDQRASALPLTTSAFPTGSVTIGNNSIYSLDNYLNFVGSKTFNPNFSGSLTLGTEITSATVVQNFTTGQTLLAPKPYTLTNTVTYIPFVYQSEIHTLSYYLHATAALYDQLYLTLGVRRDGFSTFGASEPFAYYPQAAIAWNFTNAVGNSEQKGTLSYGKLRMAYGQTGKAPTVYATNTVLNTGSGCSFFTGYGDCLSATQNGFGGLYSSATLGNENLVPERQTETELGADFGFFDQIADAGITWYQNIATKIIQTLPIPPSTGASSALSNAAEIHNTGWEVTANVRPVTTAKTSMEFGITWGQNFTTATKLGGAEYVSTYSQFGGTFSSAYGAFQINQGLIIRGKDFVRCGHGLTDVSDPTVSAACAGQRYGTMYIAANGFPVSEGTEQVIGNPEPAWMGGFRGSMRYEKWTVNFQVDHKQGGQVWNGTKLALYNFGVHKDTEIRGQLRTFGTDFFVGPVTGAGAGIPVVIGQAWYQGLGTNFAGPTADGMEDGTYTKLREIGVQYTWDGKWVTHNLGLSSVGLRLAGRNLYTWTKYTGIDPETTLGGASVTLQGYDYFNSPQTKSYVFAISLNR